MLSDREFTDFINEIGYEIDILEGKLFSVETKKILNRIGFPNNWRDILDMEWGAKMKKILNITIPIMKTAKAINNLTLTLNLNIL